MEPRYPTWSNTSLYFPDDLNCAQYVLSSLEFTLNAFGNHYPSVPRSSVILNVAPLTVIHVDEVLCGFLFIL